MSFDINVILSYHEVLPLAHYNSTSTCHHLLPLHIKETGYNTPIPATILRYQCYLAALPFNTIARPTRSRIPKKSLPLTRHHAPLPLSPYHATIPRYHYHPTILPFPSTIITPPYYHSPLPASTILSFPANKITLRLYHFHPSALPFSATSAKLPCYHSLL